MLLNYYSAPTKKQREEAMQHCITISKEKNILPAFDFEEWINLLKE